MTEKLISIIMPVYNCEKYVGQAIKSVKHQKYTNWELIIVNDGSTDKSLEKIEIETQEIKPKVKIINLKNNTGAANARNIALNKAKGSYIAYIDADDLWKEEKLNKQLLFMQQQNIVFSYTGYSRIKENGEFFKIIDAPNTTDYNQLLKNGTMLPSTIMIDITQINKKLLKMPPLRSAEDVQTWLSILKTGVVAYGLNDNLTEYRIRKNSTSSNKIKSIINIWKVYREYQSIGIMKSIYYIFMHKLNALKRRIVMM